MRSSQATSEEASEERPNISEVNFNVDAVAFITSVAKNSPSISQRNGM